MLSAVRLKAFRAATYRLKPGLRLRSKDQAVRFIQERGFSFFWPIQGIELPSLWAAAAGNRPVPSEHDDPGHVTWGWKDSLLGARRWYYAKVLRKRGTMISLEVAPYFYALSENYGSMEEDYLVQYEAGRMTAEAKQVYEALLEKGPLDTVALRREARMTSRDSDARFGRALTALQADLKVLPVGVAEAGAWRYAYVYDLVPRHFPELVESARSIEEPAARRKLLELYFRSVGAAPLDQPKKVFQWRPDELQAALGALLEAGVLQIGLAMKGSEGEWIALSELAA
ncbi:MAG TPA: crosslink repair DNA glycosylase YcaQ family protein [Anaerolineales bacterium]